jgi:hypothetical protein
MERTAQHLGAPELERDDIETLLLQEPDQSGKDSTPGLGASCVVPRATIDVRLTDSAGARRRSRPNDELGPVG